MELFTKLELSVEILLAMTAGIATLLELKNNNNIYQSLEDKTSYLEKGMREDIRIKQLMTLELIV